MLSRVIRSDILRPDELLFALLSTGRLIFALSVLLILSASVFLILPVFALRPVFLGSSSSLILLGLKNKLDTVFGHKRLCLHQATKFGLLGIGQPEGGGRRCRRSMIEGG